MLASKINPWSSKPETNYFWKYDCSVMVSEEILNLQNLYFPCLYFEKPTGAAFIRFPQQSKSNSYALYNTTNFAVFPPSFPLLIPYQNVFLTPSGVICCAEIKTGTMKTWRK